MQYSIATCKKTEGIEVRCFYFVKTAFGSCLIESKGRSLKHRSGKIQQGTEVVLKPPPHHVTTGVRDLGEDVYNTQKTPATYSFCLQIFTTSHNKERTHKRSVSKWNVKVSHSLMLTIQVFFLFLHFAFFIQHIWYRYNILFHKCSLSLFKKLHNHFIHIWEKEYLKCAILTYTYISVCPSVFQNTCEKGQLWGKRHSFYHNPLWNYNMPIN